MLKLSGEQAAYLAGAIDGEGSFSLVPRSLADGRYKSASFNARIQIANVRRDWLEILSQWVGGGWLERHPSRFNKRECFQLRFVGKQAEELLGQIQPYLLMKRAQAQVFLKFFECAAERKATNRRGEVSDPTIIARMVVLHAELKALNQRGVTAAPIPPATADVRRCSIEDCGRRHYSNNYCRKHYRRYIERGGFKSYERICANCHAPFVARRKDTECCSKACSDRFQYVKNQDARNAYKRAWRKAKQAGPSD